jgi:hypothetical protein
MTADSIHARPFPPVRTAAARGLVRLQRSESSLLIPLGAVARRQGFTIDKDRARMREVRLRSTLASMGPAFQAAAEGSAESSDSVVRFSLGLAGQATSDTAWLQSALAATSARTPLDEVIAIILGRTQLPNGRWRVGAPSLPVQESDIQTTALVIRVLLTFAPAHPDTTWRVERARAWLLTSAAVTAPDRAYRLLGLTWAGADHSDVKEAMRALVREQGPDGGWAQLPGLNADAYATGLALVALREGGEMLPSHRAYQRGAAYLIRTQEDDGSWFVHNRAASINRYVESGFPHGMHQFSSFAGTAWATMALMYAAGQSAP